MADTRERLRAAGMRWPSCRRWPTSTSPPIWPTCRPAGSRCMMKRLVLAGAGHAHALVLRQLAQQPLAGVEVVVVSPEPLAPYSGMVPGWLAGLYRFDEIVIDLPPLARAAGALWRQTARCRRSIRHAGNCSWPMARCWTTTCCR
jgi:hypothetical protein